MTDPLLADREISASAAERLAALRQPSTSKKRTKPAHTSKVLAAGLSATALFGMIAVMGYESGTGTAQTAALPVAIPTIQAAVPTPVAPTVAPLVPATPAPVVPTPAAAVPVAPVPVAPVPVAPAAPVPVIEVPVVQVPVAVAAQTTSGGQSNTTTKSSG